MKRQLHLNLFIHSRGHHEASWRHPGTVAVGADRHPLLPGSGAARRGGAVRLDLPRRPAGARRRCGAGGAHLARTRHRAGGDGGGDEPHRDDRHRLDHLYRAVQPGAPVRLARPYQQRPRRLEHRHLVARDRGAQFRRRGPGQPCRPLCPRRRVHDRGQGVVGQLGRGRGHRRPGRADNTRGRTASGRSTTAAISTRWPGR